MKKKVSSYIAVLSLSFSIGCYSNQTITRDQLDTMSKETLKAKFEQLYITVLTNDSLEYKFLKDNYRIQSDTLVGIGVQTSLDNDERFHGSIPFANIASLRTREFDAAATMVAIGIPVGLAAGLLISVASSLSGR